MFNFERMLATTGGKLPLGIGIPDAITVSVLGALDLSTLFTELDNHIFDSAVDENHVYGLIKIIKVILYQCTILGRKPHMISDLSGKIIRKKLSKLILFNHQ